MDPMSTAYEAGGRTEQKQRTRAALLEAARRLITDGAVPTVEDAAAAASISRATAYRYFPSQRALLTAAHPTIDESYSLLPADAPADPAARLDLAITRLHESLLETEPQMRTMLRLSLEASDAERRELFLRQGRAIRWLEEALAPLRGEWTDDELRRVVLAIRSAASIEAFVWLVDVAGLERREATELMHWTAISLFRTALAERRER